VSVETFIHSTETLIILYFVVLNTIYLAFTAMAFVDLIAYRRQVWRGALASSLSESTYKPISILVPAFNERLTLVATVRSLLTLRYPEFEIVVVNDGSTDDTLELMRSAYNLYPVPTATRVLLETKPVRATYRSLDHPTLVVIDKENGGKSDSLNAGINTSSYPLFCCMDADSVLEPDALLRVARAFKEDDRVVCAGGIIRVLNGSVVEDGQVTHVRTPNRPLILCQAIEYVRGFLTGRTPLGKLDALLIVSGAFGLFRKDAVVEAGGYHSGTVCEDMEIIVRLHRWSHEHDRPAKIIFVPDPVCWTQVPSDWKSLLRQRDRWQRGLLESLWMHRGMFMNPRYGKVGLIGMPFYVIFEAFGPIFELLGYVVMLLLWLFGRLNPGIAVLFFLLAVLNGIILSVMALVLDDLLFKRYERGRDLLKMIGAAFLEYCGFRQVLALQRTASFLNLLFRRGQWGTVTRTSMPDSGGMAGTLQAASSGSKTAQP
jgi:cellulose synthase/poly-beta-1,6-N-acetylglucosamine synthase-like glycosyltransferase